MSKWFEVNVTSWKRVLVEVEDDETAEDAVDIAVNEHLIGKEGEASANSDEPLDGEKLASARRHADEVMLL